MDFKGNVRIYIRVSTEEQTIECQEHLIEEAKSQGFYIAGVYLCYNSIVKLIRFLKKEFI